MSDNNDLNYFLSQPGYAGSSNAGTWQAQQGQTLSPQQSYESAASYEQRSSAYYFSKNQQENR